MDEIEGRGRVFGFGFHDRVDFIEAEFDGMICGFFHQRIGLCQRGGKIEAVERNGGFNGSLGKNIF